MLRGIVLGTRKYHQSSRQAVMATKPQQVVKKPMAGSGSGIVKRLAVVET
jgi:hypothetical protein